MSNKENLRKKKVILYNTTVNGILNGNEQYLKKLRYVLDTFKNRDDVVLWWRPHPLSKTTFESMRPGLLKEYEQIVDEYIREGWGIYDNTPDLHRAIAWSDAYYGDQSSVIPLYQATGKPVMISKVFLLPPYINNNEYPLIPIQFHDIGSDFIFTAYGYRTLFKMNKNTYKVECIGSFPGNARENGTFFGEMTEYDGKLYFAPAHADYIGVYTIETGELDLIKIKYIGEDYEYRFHTAYTYGEDIYFFGCMYPAIIRLNTMTKQITYITNYISLLDKIKNSDNKYLGYGCVIQNKMYLNTFCSDAVVVLNMDDCSTEVIRMPGNQSGYSGMCYDGNTIWLITKKGGEIVTWNLVDEPIKITAPDGWSDMSYATLCYAGGYVWCFPTESGTAYKINTETKEFEIVKAFAKHISYGTPQVINDLMLVGTRDSNTLILYDILADEHRETQPQLPPEYKEKHVNDFLATPLENKQDFSVDSNSMLPEHIVFHLSTYIDMLINPTTHQINTYNYEKLCTAETAGELILNNIKQVL